MPWAAGAYPFVAASVGKFLGRPDIRRGLEDRGRIFLSGVILKLNVFQRFFISAAQYDRTLAERMPEIIDELVVQITEILGEDSIKRNLLAMLEKTALGVLSDPAFSAFVSRFILKVFAEQCARPLGELLEYAGGVKALAGKLPALLRTLLLSRPDAPDTGAVDAYAAAESPDGGASFVSSVLERIGGQYGDMELGAFLSIRGEGKVEMDAFIAEKMLAFADGQIAGILAAVNVKAMVSERIDSLEMERVEGIILDVMARELKWINIFGAVLGFLIGIFQAVFSWLLRIL
jgi:hypothetical protein